MKSPRLPAIGLLCLVASTRIDASQPIQIQIVDSYNKTFNLHSYADGKVDEASKSYVKLRIRKRLKYETFGVETELLLSNDAKSEIEKPVICENADRTIVALPHAQLLSITP
jgi:hypothetical protein